jgi:hypothetical protein
MSYYKILVSSVEFFTVSKFTVVHPFPQFNFRTILFCLSKDPPACLQLLCTPSPGNDQLTLYRPAFSRLFIQVGSRSKWLMTGIFHSAWFWSSSKSNIKTMFSHVLVLNSLLSVSGTVSLQILLHWVLSHYVDPFINWGTFGLFPLWDRYQYSCSKPLYAGLCVDLCFHFFWIHWYKFVFNFLKKYQIVFQSGCTIFIVPPERCECSNLSISLPELTTILIIAILEDGKWHLTVVLF